MDFFIPGVRAGKIREVGLRLQRGGVGFYPTSGSPFVHLDTGSIRHWPRMTHDQLARVFPDGRTVHIPSDGQPLANYALALADVERQGHSPSAQSLVAARNSGVIDENEERAANAPQRGLLAGLFGFKDETKIAPVAAPPPVTMASLRPPAQVAPAVPMPKRRPAREIAIATYVPTPAARPALPVEIASADPIMTASASQALAYAAEAPAPAVAVAALKPMGVKLPKVRPAPVTAKLASAAPSAPTAVAHAQPRQSQLLGDNPWLRAVILAPNASSFLTASATAKYDTRQFGDLVKKPTSAVLMSFVDDPHYGLTTERFTGSAVVFVATASFGTRTASLK